MLLRQLLLRPGASAAAQNLGWLVAERLMRLGFSVLVGFAVARYLGPAQFGVLNYAFALVTLAAAVAEMGVEAVVKREIIQSPAEAPAWLAAAWWLRLGAGAACYGLVLAWSWWGERAGVARVLLAIVGLLLFQPALSIANLWLQARLQAGRAVAAQLVALAIGAGARLLLILLAAPLWTFGAVTVVEAVLAAVLMTVMARKAGMRIGAARGAGAPIGRLMADSWPLLLSGLTVIIYMRIDVVMLQRLAGPDQAGIYAAAVRLSEVWFFLPVALGSSLLPGLLAARAAGAANYAAALQRFFDLNVALAYTLALPMVLLAPRIVALAYGVNYTAASPVLAVHAWTLVGVALGVARGQFCVNEGLTRFHLGATTAGAALNILLNLWLIPRHGPVGAAWATLAAQAVATWLSSFCSRPVRACAVMQTRALFVPLRWPAAYLGRLRGHDD